MVKINIEYDEIHNKLQVDGPFENKIIFCGVLELTKHLVLTQAPSKVLSATGAHLPSTKSEG